MSTDNPRAIAQDLALYLRQQREAGIEWYLDEGPPTTVTSPAEVHEASEVAPAAPPKSSPSSRESQTVKPKAAEATDPFDEVCRLFVVETMKQIRANETSEPAAAEGDLFNPDQDEPASSEIRDKAAELAAMTTEVAACEACKLSPTRTKTVFGAGDPDADLVIIGEAPGRNEDEQGEPFVGRSGKMLTDILQAIGFAREKVFICNILKCRPPKNRDPEADEVQACEPFLKRQLEIIQPRVICCLGRHAAMTLLQTRASLKSMREMVHFYEGIPVMATFHPAALLRNPNWKRDTWDDVRKLRALYDALR